jgi:hypothetical protein
MTGSAKNPEKHALQEVNHEPSIFALGIQPNRSFRSFRCNTFIGVQQRIEDSNECSGRFGHLHVRSHTARSDS